MAEEVTGMNNARTNTLMVLLSVATAGVGCSGGGSVEIGSAQTVGAELSDYAATWDGYVEAFNFWPDGSDRVRLTIDASGQGTFEIGNAAPLAAATDPNVGYPSITQTNTSGTGTATSLFEGFRYPIHAATVATDRIQLGVDPNELYAGWCQLQTSYDWTAQNGGYNCVPLPETENFEPSTGVCTLNFSDGTKQTVDCLKWDECFMSSVCACTSGGCVANTAPAGARASQYGVELDGVLDTSGTTLTATVTGFGRVTVVLKKQ
jgi:hypothetical protein